MLTTRQLLLAATVITSFSAAPVFAQASATAQPADADTPATDPATTATPTPAPADQARQDNMSAPQNGGALGEIVVTAQKRAENLQRVPLAVTAVGGPQLVTAGVVNTADLNRVVSGVNIRNSTGSFQPFIRGVGTTSSLVENPVALYIDGVYYPVQREGARELVDLQQVAVLALLQKS